ncbi:hypothetical protein HMPREF1129_2317 [Actinomyces naeslundii str. Howell 279]|uniref:Uncharacterized protein n=1 Tax=Actinomyces naeslundii (strain ATCC 12104 / DSM 43013 / CCUG 2238 / JCM 8349 / NCTC 10301 / Howell 279) TaxID=1115803 RepID=J2ZRT2_ACTNH|nr:hypothetical protein HMPREF1129_2317 [Actinomyces naeslundii str. Howell 279]
MSEVVKGGGRLSCGGWLAWTVGVVGQTGRRPAMCAGPENAAGLRSWCLRAPRLRRAG